MGRSKLNKWLGGSLFGGGVGLSQGPVSSRHTSLADRKNVIPEKGCTLTRSDLNFGSVIIKYIHKIHNNARNDKTYLLISEMRQSQI